MVPDGPLPGPLPVPSHVPQWGLVEASFTHREHSTYDETPLLRVPQGHRDLFRCPRPCPEGSWLPVGAVLGKGPPGRTRGGSLASGPRGVDPAHSPLAQLGNSLQVTGACFPLSFCWVSLSGPLAAAAWGAWHAWLAGRPGPKSGCVHLPSQTPAERLPGQKDAPVCTQPLPRGSDVATGRGPEGNWSSGHHGCASLPPPRLQAPHRARLPTVHSLPGDPVLFTPAQLPRELEGVGSASASLPCSGLPCTCLPGGL